ncbi:MAG: Ig-like domain-containing protein [Planctomycetota bacterium]
MLLANDVLPFEWVDEGPQGTIRGQLEANTTPNRRVTGAIHTVLAHPTDPDTVYIGGVNGGIWKTTEFTEVIPEWTPQIDDLESLSIGAMAFDTSDPTSNTLVAGTAKYSSFGGFGGVRGLVYRTDDGGDNWTQLQGTGIRNENISGIAARGDTIIVTSNANAGGVFRSTDGGATFQGVSQAGFVSPGDNFSDLVEDPSDPTGQRLYAVQQGDNREGGVLGGIYRSDDFGVTWVQIAGGTSSNADLDDLLDRSNNVEMAVHPTTGRLYVATLVSSQPQGIFYSSNPTAANPDWTQMDVPVLPTGFGAAITGATNADPIVITSNNHGLNTGNFVVIDGVTGNTAANGFHRITRVDANRFSLNSSEGNGGYGGGGTWQRVTGPNPTAKDIDEAGAQGRIHFSIVVDPTDEDIIYIGGDRQDQPNVIGDNTFGGAIFRGDASIPRNPNVAPSPQWDHATHDIVAFDPPGGTASGTAPHADSREMVFDAAGNLVEVDDGGVFIRTNPRDNTGDWISKAGTLGVIEFHDVAYDSVSNILIGGTQDNGTQFQQSDTNTEWDFLSGGDGGDVVVDAVSLAGLNRSIRYTSFQNIGGFTKSTWDANNNLLGREFPDLRVTSGSAFDPAFKTPVQLNAVNPNRLLIIGDNGIYESLDQGENIAEVEDRRRLGFLQDAVDYGGFQNGVGNENVFYAGLQDRIYVRTTDATVAEYDLDPTSGADVRDVVMDPENWATAYAIDNNNVFVTENAGVNWTDITGDLMSIAGEVLQTIAFVPGPIGALVVGGSQGVFSSRLNDLGEWIEVGANFPNSYVFDLIYNVQDDLLVAGTLGRGAWSLPEASTSLGGPELVASNQELRTIEDIDGGLVIEPLDLLRNTLVDGVPITGDQTDVFVQSVNAVTGMLDSANRDPIQLLQGGTLSATFDVNGYIDGLLFEPAQDFNSENPLGPTGDFTDELFEFTVIQPAATPDPLTSSATAGIRVTPQNDAPVVLPEIVEFSNPDYQTFYADLGEAPPEPLEGTPFTFRYDFLLQNDSQGPITAGDENGLINDGRLEIIEALPALDFFGEPDPNIVGIALNQVSRELTIETTPDFHGEVQFTYTVQDRGINQASELNPSGEPADKLLAELTAFPVTASLIIEPVNDAPVLNPAVLPAAQTNGPDEAYSVDNDGVFTFTLREDNTQDDGTPAPFFIPFHATGNGGYDPVGLLDIFSVGPANEEDASPGGSQSIVFDSAGNPPVNGGSRTTDRGGKLDVVFDENDPTLMIGLNYTPPADFNRAFAGIDSFNYTVRDDGVSFMNGVLVPDPQTNSQGSVEFLLNPVNDRPTFFVATNDIIVQEDSPLIEFGNFATNVHAGPFSSAFDEVDSFNGQSIEFMIEPNDPSFADSFKLLPEIDPSLGSLQFELEDDVSGDFVFTVTLQDDGPVDDQDSIRGDRNVSEPLLLTISVLPINDPPVLDPTADPLFFQLDEDPQDPIVIPVNGDIDQPGLLDVFLPGPIGGSGDESGDEISLSRVPSRTTQGGSLIQTTDEFGNPQLEYRPRANFVGLDSFIYTVVDDGTTVGFDGVPFTDPRIATNIVQFQVDPVNDPPIFGGGVSVTSLEDRGLLGPGEVEFPNWVFNVQAGPSTALDELGGLQTVEFEITQIDQTPDNFTLFRTPPTVRMESDGSYTLVYESAPEASGVGTFEVFLEDNLGARSTTRTFNVNVTPVNDPPTFEFIDPNISLLEDNGPLTTQLIDADTIDPGAPNESDQTVSFQVLPLEPQFEALFTSPPTISPTGELRFTPAANQNTDNVNGPAVIQVVAVDSEGGTAPAKEFQISIAEVNDPPRAVSDPNSDEVIESDEDSVLQFNQSVLIANDVDPDLETNADEVLNVVLLPETTSVNGARVLFDSETGTITYDPSEALALQALRPNESAIDSFTYSLIDAAGATSNSVTVEILINGINDAPRTQNDEMQLSLEGGTTVPVLANDFDVDGTIVPNTISVALQPAFGTVQIESDGSLTYTAFTSFTDTDIFEYTVRDNLGDESDPATVTIIANQRPIAGDDSAGTFLGETIAINVAANDIDPDGGLDLTSIVILSDPERGEVIPRPNGTVSYVPDDNFIGRDEFTYQIFDLLGRPSNIATVETSVVSSRLQNPERSNDVNNDGFVTAIDPLLIINHLTRSEASSIPVLPTDQGPDFYDTSGDQLISALDVLQIINALSRQSDGGNFEGEQVLAPAAQPAGAIAEGEFDDLPEEMIDSDKICYVPSTDGSFQAAVDAIAEDQSDSEEENATGAIDAVMSDLTL